MAMGKRKRRQESLFVATTDLARSPGHPFYKRLNELLAEAEFDRWIEAPLPPYYEQEEERGRPSIPPGVYFRMLLVGYFEGIDSPARHRLAVCRQPAPGGSSWASARTSRRPTTRRLTNTRKRLPSEVFDEVFQFVLKIAAEKKLLAGQDGRRRQHDAGGERGDEEHRPPRHGRRLEAVRHAADAGGRRHRRRTHEPTDEEVRRFDKGRKNKKVSNDEWVSPTDPEARITQMKDGRTHLAYKAEHVVDLESELILAAEIRPATDGDAQTLVDSVVKAEENLAGGRDRRADRRSGGRQGLSLGRDARTLRRPGPADVHSRAEAQARPGLDRQAGRAEASRVREPAADEAGQRKTLAAGCGASGSNGPSPTSATRAACAAVG